MKRITSILAVMALSSAAYAADTVDMKWNAEMRTRYTSDANYGTVKGQNFNSFFQRNKLGLHLTKGESFQGHISLVNNFAWGGANTTRPMAVAPAAGNHNALLVNEAYGWWKANDMVSIKFGRSGMEVAGGFVMSTYDWQQDPYSYDGAWTMWDFEPVNLNLFGLKRNDPQAAGTASTTVGNTDPEDVTYGAVVGFKTLPDVVKKAEIHVLQNNNEATTITGTSNGSNNVRTEVLRYGLIASGDVSGFDYRLVYDMFSGKQKTFASGSSTDVDLTGNMLDVALGYTMAEMMMMRFGVVYHMDSGDDGTSATSNKTYRAGTYDVWSHGGTYLDAVAWGNLTYLGLNFSIKPQEDLTTGLRYTKFERTNDRGTVAVYTNARGTGTSSKDVGSEIDVFATKTYGENFSIWALYGTFTPGDVVKQGGGGTDADTHTRIQLQGKLTF